MDDSHSTGTSNDTGSSSPAGSRSLSSAALQNIPTGPSAMKVGNQNKSRKQSNSSTIGLNISNEEKGPRRWRSKSSKAQKTPPADEQKAPPSSQKHKSQSRRSNKKSKDDTVSLGIESEMLTNGIEWLANRSKVFVCLDLEFWEMNNAYLTEIGISVYDPTQIPLDRPLPIIPKIKACHYVVDEHKTKVNGKFVPNNMFKFSYGQTLVMPLNQCKVAVDEILASLAKNNNLVIVGHGVSGDLQMLVKQGCKIPAHQVLDTSTIWRATRKDGFGSLSKLLEYFNIPHALMHNAGNDAYLNLYLFLVLCDPEVRHDMKLDETQDPEEYKLLNPHPQRKRGRRRDVPAAFRETEASDAVNLMVGETVNGYHCISEHLRNLSIGSSQSVDS